MCVTMHHGHWLGGQKCKGDQALCAQCLRTGTRVEETATHVHHDCATAKAVWELVAGHWHRATGEELDLSSPLQAIAGLRKPPATGCESATAAWKAREPAWRLLHSVTLLQLYRASSDRPTALVERGGERVVILLRGFFRSRRILGVRVLSSPDKSSTCVQWNYHLNYYAGWSYRGLCQEDKKR